MINITENRKYYVYEWYLESTGEVFHVGKGCDNRYKEKKVHRNDYFKNVINKHGDDAKSRIVIDNLTEQEAWDKEKELIAQYKAIGQCKTNLHEGGHGGYTGNYDNPERSRKISEARKKAPSKKGPENPLYGKRLSEEHKQKINRSLKGIVFTEEYKAKIGEASKRNWTSEMQEKLLEGRLKKLETLTPEEKFKFVDHLCHY